jgi:serine/threonine protein kinase
VEADRTPEVPEIPSRPWAPGVEPIPGYRLVCPLGRGGFGEVWKCEAPGGLGKAVKRVPRGGLAQQEREALERVKSIRHPFILTLERLEDCDEDLLVVMELADRSLQDVYTDCRNQGMKGIPRRDLLALLLEAAEALDWMNFGHNLQHLDIKPHNLFVFSNHLKVADFGLVHCLKDGPRTSSSATPLYAAPEILGGGVSRHSDQYSLAVVYQQLLTGSLPYMANAMRDLKLKHQSGRPELANLPPDDRPIMARALAYDPDKRFPSCLAFLQALVCGPHVPNGMESDGPMGPLTRVFGPGHKGLPSSSGSRPALRDQSEPLSWPQSGLGRPSAGTIAQASRTAAVESPPRPVNGSATCASTVGFRFLNQMGASLQEEVWCVQEDGIDYRALWLGSECGSDDALIARLAAVVHPDLPRTRVLRGPSNRLLLVSRRAESSLADRFEACRAAGHSGIPRAELLGYMRQAAAALDAAARDLRLPHLGLHPRNLLLDRGQLQVADLGVVALALLPAGRTAARFNPRYAPPEGLEGRFVSQSDQYSLALIYAEMLTGAYPRSRPSGSGTHRRLTGSSPLVPVMTRGFKIDLDLIVACDREVLARALDPEPSRRFESCTALVEALENAGNHIVQEAMRGLPAVLHFSPGQDSNPLSPPRIEQLIAEVTLDPDFPGFPAVAVPDKNQSGKRSWTLRFPIRLIPGATLLKIKGFCEEWNGRLIRQELDDCLIQIDLGPGRPGAEPPGGQRRHLEVHLKIFLYPGAIGGYAEARATFRVVPDLGRENIDILDQHGPRLLDTLRCYLNACAERRTDERWHCPQPLHIYPIIVGARLGKAVSGVSKNISRTGVSFLVREPVETTQVYLHWYRLPRLAPFAILAQVARVRQIGGDDGFEVGATLGLGNV